jgi:pyridinium-3,5-bisthiocarboxylic acid mononucleotide nickel chelatase
VATSQKSPLESGTSVRKGPIKFERDIIAIIETNVDDTTGEIIARTIEKLITEGALDATAASYLGKKGREGYTIRVVCPTDAIEKFAQILVEETGTLGVKMTEFTRLIVPRRTVAIPVAIENFHGNVSVKVAEWKGRILRIKPELAEARQISESQKVPLRDVLELVSIAARQFLMQSSPETTPDQQHSQIAQKH